MSTTDTVLLIILTTLMSLFFLLAIVAVIAVLKLVSGVRHAVDKAERVIDTVESATSVVRDVSGPLAAFKLIKNLVDLLQRKK